MHTYICVYVYVYMYMYMYIYIYITYHTHINAHNHHLTPIPNHIPSHTYYPRHDTGQVNTHQIPNKVKTNKIELIDE